METECQIHHKKVPCEECKAEQQKKQELYHPEGVSCGDPYDCDGDCDNCSFSEDKYYSEFEEDEE